MDGRTYLRLYTDSHIQKKKHICRGERFSHTTPTRHSQAQILKLKRIINIYIYIYIYNAMRRKLKPGLIVILKLFRRRYHYTFRLIKWLHTFNLSFENSKFACMKKKWRRKKNYINSNYLAKVKGLKQWSIRKIKKPGKSCSCKLTNPTLNIC